MLQGRLADMVIDKRAKATVIGLVNINSYKRINNWSAKFLVNSPLRIM